MTEYYIGLDIGTNSVGWAVTDTEYRVLKKNGKALWGVRLFEEAQSAQERRSFRTGRRRMERRKQRLDFLRQVFSEEIGKKDPAFFQRLEESKFLLEDKKLTENGKILGKYTLFADKNYSDKQYYQEFPTIYHLRRALMQKEQAFDVRLVYLAVHHILKNRGHFLFGDMNLEEVSFERCMEELKDLLFQEYDCELQMDDLEKVSKMLTNRKNRITDKKKALKQLLKGNKEEQKLIGAICDLLAGGSVKASAFARQEIAKEEDKSFSFPEYSEEKDEEIRTLLSEDMQIVDQCKKIFDWALLDELKNGEDYISCAKVKVYEQHEKELADLKEVLKADRNLYREMFSVTKDKLNNYTAYSGHGAKNYRCQYDDFRKYAKKQLDNLTTVLGNAEKQKVREILEKLEQGTFLAKQTNRDNGVIPHQLHEQELKIILERAGTYLPFLNEKDESGLSRKEQILEIFRFRVPYYVGPLYAKRPNEHGWVVRSEEKIWPWNFEKVVDLPKTAENFITRMTATCSYIGEPVLPMDSLLYSRYNALNMLNKLTVNGFPISVEAKQRIYQEHLLQNGKTNAKLLKGYLLSNGMMEKNDKIGGVDENFKISLAGEKIFRRILSAGNCEEMVEDIIRHIVLFSEDRKLLERWLKTEYGNVLSTEDQAYVLRQCGKFKGWGRLSREFLTQIRHEDAESGKGISIIDALWTTNLNLMELLSENYTFREKVEKYREEKFSCGKQNMDEILKDSYASPAIRRAIHQTMGIIAEIEKIMRGEPKRVFVEVTREEGKKERIPSRKDRLMELYAACKKEAPEVLDHLQRTEEPELRSAKLYLYFTQMGRCMYSGETIPLECLESDYDIDHIYPQSRVKDDSLDNRVLVKKQLNAEKGDSFPIGESIRKDRKAFWTMLRERKLISGEKYARLTRRTGFEDSELSGFIARQLVETSQSAKIITDLLKMRYGGNDKVVYVKAKNVASFRQDQRVLPDGTKKQARECKNLQTQQDPLFIKCREVNDLHHAKDAYLNIVVGNVYHVKFTKNPLNYIRQRQPYSLNCMFDRDVERNGEWAWKKGDEGSIATVRHAMGKNNILFTRYAHEVGGGLFDQKIVAKTKGQAMIKSSDPRMTTENYGGYNKLTGAYFCLVEYTNNGKRERSIETVFLMYKKIYEKNPEEYCKCILDLQDAKILIPKIKIDSLFSLDGFRMHVSGRTGERLIYKNANQLILSPEENRSVKQIAKYLERCKAAREELKISSYDRISQEHNAALFGILTEKLGTARYSVKYSGVLTKLKEKQEAFSGLSLKAQGQLLMEILHLFDTTANCANLELMGEGKRVGTILTSKDLKSICKAGTKHTFKLIHQSITGVFEQEIDLMGEQF